MYFSSMYHWKDYKKPQSDFPESDTKSYKERMRELFEKGEIDLLEFRRVLRVHKTQIIRHDKFPS